MNKTIKLKPDTEGVVETVSETFMENGRDRLITHTIRDKAKGKCDIIKEAEIQDGRGNVIDNELDFLREMTEGTGEKFGFAKTIETMMITTDYTLRRWYLLGNLSPELQAAAKKNQEILKKKGILALSDEKEIKIKMRRASSDILLGGETILHSSTKVLPFAGLVEIDIEFNFNSLGLNGYQYRTCDNPNKSSQSTDAKKIKEQKKKNNSVCCPDCIKDDQTLRIYACLDENREVNGLYLKPNMEDPAIEVILSEEDGSITKDIQIKGIKIADITYKKGSIEEIDFIEGLNDASECHCFKANYERLQYQVKNNQNAILNLIGESLGLIEVAYRDRNLKPEAAADLTKVISEGLPKIDIKKVKKKSKPKKAPVKKARPPLN